MIRRPPRSTRTDTLVPYTTLFRSNACEPAPFIVSFHADGPPKLFGPLETCRPVSIDPEGDVLRLIEVGVPGERVKSWTWSPSGSLSEAPYVFPMTKGMGWASLWDRTVDHPSDLLGSAEIVADLRALTGDMW